MAVSRKSDPQPVIEMMRVGPRLAKEFMDLCAHNREIRARHVESLARDMANGRFLFNGDTIKFDWTGNLIDGQHRLLAIIKSGTTQQLCVVRGLPAEAQDVVDIGRGRRAHDVLHLHGYNNSALLVAIARKALAWQRGDRRSIATPNYPSTTQEILSMVEHDVHVNGATAVAIRHRITIPATPSVVGMGWWLFANIDIEKANQFYAMLAEGSDLPRFHPALTLRNKLVRQNQERSGRRLDQALVLAEFIRAWNAWREGRTLERLLLDLDPGTFPEPI